MVTTIPAYKVPSDPMRRKMIREMIRYEVQRKIFDVPTNNVLDVRRVAVFMGPNDDVISVMDAGYVRGRLAEDDTLAEMFVGKFPGVQLFYTDEKVGKAS